MYWTLIHTFISSRIGQTAECVLQVTRTKFSSRAAKSHFNYCENNIDNDEIYHSVFEKRKQWPEESTGQV